MTEILKRYVTPKLIGTLEAQGDHCLVYYNEHRNIVDDLQALVVQQEADKMAMRCCGNCDNELNHDYCRAAITDRHEQTRCLNNKLCNWKMRKPKC